MKGRGNENTTFLNSEDLCIIGKEDEG